MFAERFDDGLVPASRAVFEHGSPALQSADSTTFGTNGSDAREAEWARPAIDVPHQFGVRQRPREVLVRKSRRHPAKPGRHVVAIERRRMRPHVP